MKGFDEEEERTKGKMEGEAGARARLFSPERLIFVHVVLFYWLDSAGIPGLRLNGRIFVRSSVQSRDTRLLPDADCRIFCAGLRRDGVLVSFPSLSG